MKLQIVTGKAGCKPNKHIAQGIALGVHGERATRPERAKALIIKLLPFQGAWKILHLITQGVALGYVLLPRWGEWIVSN